MGGEARLAALLATPALRDMWRNTVERCSWRAPLFSREVVSVTGTNARMALSDKGLRVAAYVRFQMAPVRLSNGTYVIRAERVNVPEAEGAPHHDKRPAVVTLDDL